MQHFLEIRQRRIVRPPSYANLMTHDYSSQIIIGSSSMLGTDRLPFLRWKISWNIVCVHRDGDWPYRLRLVEAFHRQGLNGPGSSCSIADGSSREATEVLWVALIENDGRLTGLNAWVAHDTQNIAMNFNLQHRGLANSICRIRNLRIFCRLISMRLPELRG